jgi:hypothetical protein
MGIFLGRKFLSATLFEPDRRDHLSALLRGVRDGVLNRGARRYLPAGAEPPGVDWDRA